MYVGESERNVREIFASARSQSPCILFFDELDSLAPARGRGSDGGGVMDRVVSQILTEMDSLSSSSSPAKSQGIFVMGATNRPDLLDPSLLRPGRLDVKIFLSSCKDIHARYSILKAQTRKYSLSKDVNLMEVAETLSDCVTGADISALTSRAYASAMKSKMNSLAMEALGISDLQILGNDSSRMKELFAVAAHVDQIPSRDLNIEVSQQDLMNEARQLVATVTYEELVRYESLGRQFDDSKTS